jgi:hypothetical protein
VWIVQLKYARSAIEANQKELLTKDGFADTVVSL